MKHTLLTLTALALSINANAANPFILDYTAAGIKEPAQGSSDFFTLEGERQDIRRAIETANLGDDNFEVTLKNVPRYIALMEDFVMDAYVQPAINYYALNEWLLNTIGTAQSPEDLDVIKPFLQKVIQEQPNLKRYATKLLKGPYSVSEEVLFEKSDKQRKQFLKMFQ